MIRKKELLANLLFSNEFLAKAFYLRKHQNLSILAYHRVLPTVDKSYPFVRGVMSCNPEMFDMQLTFLKKHFNVINFRDLEEIHQLKEDIPPSSLILTFDDGYADNYSHMLPILKSHDLTATVFLTTHYIDTGELFWVDRLAYKINNMPEGRLELLDGTQAYEVKNTNREEVRRQIGQLCSSLTFRQHFQLLDEIYNLVDVEPTEEEYELARPMSWDEVIELDKSGVEIGTHTVMHGFLDRMTRDEIKIELLDSKETITKRLQKEAITICYPAGKYNDNVISMAHQCNYKYGCSYLHGTAKYTDKLQYQIPRIHVDDDVGMPLFKAYLTLPELFLR